MKELDYILVDGYNVLNSWEETRKHKNDFSFARYKLVDMLCDYASFRGTNVMVVFDAHRRKDFVERKEKYKGIEVIYTKEGEIADCYIERAVYLLSKKHTVGVVTSDNLEQSVAMQMGAIRITPTEFLERVKNSNKRITEKTTLSYVESKNTLENCVNEDIMQKLEKMRRNL